MKTLSKEEAMALVGTPLTNYQNAVIQKTKYLYQDDLHLNVFENMLLFPWRDWRLFTFMKENGLLQKNDKINSMPLSYVTTNYSTHYDNIWDENRDRIENLKKSISKNGFYSNSVLFAIFETGTVNRCYSIDGHHRGIAYHCSLGSGAVYTPVKCVFGEVDDICEVLKDYKHLIYFE